MFRWIIALCLLSAACAPVSEPPTAPQQAAVLPDWNMTIEGHSVRVHLVAPDTPPPWPTAMLLHGASGLGRGFMVWPVADALAERGVAAAVIEYFDALPDNVPRKGAVRHFERRERLIGQMVNHLLIKPEVMGPEVGVYGYSLGAFHGLALAAKDPRIAAVAALAGGLPRHVPVSAVARAAPVLLVHGTRDRVVPYSRARETEMAWQTHGRPASVLQLKNTGHVPAPTDRKRLAAIAADFLAKELLFQVASLP